jgi:hypothetical protein
MPIELATIVVKIGIYEYRTLTGTYGMQTAIVVLLAYKHLTFQTRV